MVEKPYPGRIGERISLPKVVRLLPRVAWKKHLFLA
jgi:hypothetical protein